MGEEVVAKHQEGHSVRVISALIGVPQRTTRSIFSKWKMYVTVKDLPCKGRPRKTTVRDDDHLSLLAWLQDLTSSMQNRLAALVQTRGGHIEC